MNEFKNLPSGWKVVRLGDVCEINPSSRKLPEKFYYIDLESVEKGILHSLKEVFLETAPSRAQRLLEKGDILFQMVRPYQKNNFLFELNGNFVASTGYAQIRTKQNRDFIFQYLNFDTFTKKVIEKCTGSNYPAINASVFSNLMILLPPLDEQEKIAEILSTWDEAINLTTNLIESKKQLKKALMQNLLTAKIRFPQFKDEWINEKLNKVTFFQEGPGVRNTQYKKEGIKLLNVGNLNNNTLNLNTTTTYISETEAYGAYKHFLIDDGDLLISCSGINSTSFKNKIAFAEKKDLPLCLNTSTMRFKSLDDRLLLKYLYYFFQTIYFERQVLGVLTGSAQFNFGPTHIKWFKIKLPNLKEQQKIAEVLTSCDDEINLLNLKLENLKKQKQGLMQKLLSGKVRVRYV